VAKLHEKIQIEELNEPYREIAEKIGVESAVEVAKLFGGSQVYFPKLDSVLRIYRDALIKKEFNGYNYRELSKKYGLSETWVRLICKELALEKQNEPLERQIKMEAI